MRRIAGGRSMFGLRAAVLTVAAMALASGAAVAAPPAAPPPTTIPPGQAVAGPPAWVTAGTRITQYSAVATVAAGGYELIEDPNGSLLDPTTGKRYRESYTATTATSGTEGTGGSGDGFYELTIAAVEGTDVVFSRVYIGNDPLSGTRTIQFAEGVRAPGATVPGLWYQPDQLAQLKTGDLGSALVLRGPVTAGGQEYQAISIVDPTPGAYSFFAYDSVTGVQLIAAMRNAPVAGGPVQLGYTELRSVRQLAIPGIGAAVPAWLAARPQLQYTGTLTFRNPFDSISPPTTSPLTSTVTFPDMGATWALVQTASTVTQFGSSPLSSTTTGAVGGAGPYWWDPAALATMTVGQVLDSDPVTGTTLSVSAVTPSGSGTIVTIDGVLSGGRASAQYDATSGVLLAQTSVNSVTGFTTAVQLLQMP